MKTEDAREMTDLAIETLRASLEGGKSDALIAFLRFAARFHKYSWGNLLLILAQRPEATRVAGFHMWRSFGRAVKKGEKGIGIMAPILVRNREETPGIEAQSEARRDRKLWFKVAYVFDVTQTEGEELPALRHAAGDPAHFAERLREVVRARGIRLELGGIVGAALGTSSGGVIKIREGLAPADEFATLAHELAHEILHHGADAERGNKTTVETEAEAVAFVVATAVGLDVAGASSDYIQLYRGDAKTLAGSLDRIQRTASGIVAELLAGDG